MDISTTSTTVPSPTTPIMTDQSTTPGINRACTMHYCIPWACFTQVSHDHHNHRRQIIIFLMVKPYLRPAYSHRCRWSQCAANSSRSYRRNCSGPVCICGDIDHCTGHWCRDAIQEANSLAKEEEVCPTLTYWSLHSNAISMPNIL